MKLTITYDFLLKNCSNDFSTEYHGNIHNILDKGSQIKNLGQVAMCSTSR